MKINIIKDLIKEGVNYQNRGNHDLAIKKYNEVLKIDELNVESLNNLSVVYINTTRLDLAENILLKLINKVDDLNAINHLSVIYMRTARAAGAITLLNHALSLDPYRFQTYLNITNAYALVNNNDMALHYALEAIKLEPSSSAAFNNLGSILMNKAMDDEAQIALETAVELDPKNLESVVNLGALLSRKGKAKEAVAVFKSAIKKLPKQASMQVDVIKFLMSFELLKLGKLEEGWKNYDAGFHPNIPSTNSRGPNRSFKRPRWDGRSNLSKTVLLWREQGLGDELMFLTCLNDLIKYQKNIILEADRRLVDILSRSFPTIKVRSEQVGFPPKFESLTNDYDYHFPLASLMGLFRNSLEKFNNNGKYIVVDNDRKEKFDARLGKQRKLRVGISWRSGLLSELRVLSYLSLLKMGDLLTVDNIQWVNLQYGDCEKEIASAEEEFNIKIERWNDLNLKDDLDDVFSLISCLDCVLTAPTSVSSMGPIVGVKTFMFQAGPDWTMLGTDYDPWFESLERISSDTGNLYDCIPLLREKIQHLAGKKLNV